ncbi:hypothetical protein C7E14_22675, partial [Stenotrophomonas maltophilia]
RSGFKLDTSQTLFAFDFGACANCNRRLKAELGVAERNFQLTLLELLAIQQHPATNRQRGRVEGVHSGSLLSRCRSGFSGFRCGGVRQGDAIAHTGTHLRSGFKLDTSQTLFAFDFGACANCNRRLKAELG